MMARMQGKTTSDVFKCFAGVEVSKAHLDLRVAGTVRGARFANDDAGIATLPAQLDPPHPGPYLVVLEPTGRYHLALWRALDGAGHGVAPVNPWAARKLADGPGHLAKTDAVDAFVLAQIAQRFPPAVRPAPDGITLEIKELYAARGAAIRRRAMGRTQAVTSGNALVRSLLATEEATLTAQIKALTKALTTLFEARQGTRRTRDILTSIPGSGAGAAIAILTELPEIGRASRAEIAALSGTAPMTRQSGQSKGRARTRGGRRSLRAALHMPAIVAMTPNPDLKMFADRLRARGKHIHAVITATLRKLLVRANTLIAENRLWTPQKP
jgi:transposase